MFHAQRDRKDAKDLFSIFEEEVQSHKRDKGIADETNNIAENNRARAKEKTTNAVQASC